nr:GDP-fucose protein O-fucosyltransferase [Tanacetum cinerariifolium]
MFYKYSYNTIAAQSSSPSMAKTKPTKNPSILTLNPNHLFTIFPAKNRYRNPQPPSTHTFFFFTLVLASVLCFASVNRFSNTPSISIITRTDHTASYTPIFVASLASVFEDPSGDNGEKDGLVSLDTTAMVPLPPRSVVGEFWEQPDGEGYVPCLDFSLEYRRRSGVIANEKKRFLVVVVSGGLFEIRNQIVDAVVIARILEASLVLPVLNGDESEFADIFDVQQFRETLKADIRVVSSLPSTHLVSWQTLENQIPHNVHPFLIRARYFKKLNEEGSLVLTGIESKLSRNLPPDLQKLRCKVAFHALKFAKPIRELGNRITRRMWIEGPYVAIHLSLEKDLLLKESGAPENSRVYIAGGEPFGGDRAILPLKSEFVNVVTKETLARNDELNPYKNRTAILTAIDYIVSLSSDVFLPSYDGHMVRALQGHRAYVGHRKIVTMSKNFKGQPQMRAKRRDRDVIAFPVPECMCKH